jgi:hypothetical protein
MLGDDTLNDSGAVYQEIRDAMLGALTRFCDEEPLLQIDISNAHDLSELWYLRPRLLSAIANAHNISIAEDELRLISNMFGSHLANAVSSKFGPL